MDSDIINDLKQFMSATISQQTSELRQEMNGFRQEINSVQQEVHGLRQEMNGLQQEVHGLRTTVTGIDAKLDGFIEFVTEAFDTNSNVTADQFKAYDQRITRLEQQAA